MKPSPELVEAARQAFYNNKGDDADCPFELMFQSLFDQFLIAPVKPHDHDVFEAALVEIFQS